VSWYRRNPLFATALTACGLLAVGELALVYERCAAARDAEKKLARENAELAAMREVTPPPARDVAAAIEADLARARRALAAMQTELKGRGPAADRMRAAKIPAARTDAYFDLATFVERTRALAKQAGVDLRPEAARLGFAAYANEGPEAERIEPVFHQRLVAQYVLEALLEAKPRVLLAVNRERALTKAERETRDAALVAAASGTPVDPAAADIMTPPEGPDYFAIEPGVTARVPNYIDTTPLRLVFVGQTAALRTFMNRLATFELPVLVRGVEVEPASAEETAPAQGDDAASSVSTAISAEPSTAPAPQPKRPAPRSTAAPLVEKPYSKFTVTVEYLDLVAPAAGTADSAGATAPGTPTS